MAKFRAKLKILIADCREELEEKFDELIDSLPPETEFKPMLVANDGGYELYVFYQAEKVDQQEEEPKLFTVGAYVPPSKLDAFVKELQQLQDKYNK